MEIMKVAEVSAEQYIKQVNVDSGCEDSGHCKYCLNDSNYSN